MNGSDDPADSEGPDPAGEEDTAAGRRAARGWGKGFVLGAD